MITYLSDKVICQLSQSHHVGDIFGVLGKQKNYPNFFLFVQGTKNLRSTLRWSKTQSWLITCFFFSSCKWTSPVWNGYLQWMGILTAQQQDVVLHFSSLNDMDKGLGKRFKGKASDMVRCYVSVMESRE